MIPFRVPTTHLLGLWANLQVWLEAALSNYTHVITAYPVIFSAMDITGISKQDHLISAGFLSFETGKLAMNTH